MLHTMNILLLFAWFTVSIGNTKAEGDVLTQQVDTLISYEEHTKCDCCYPPCCCRCAQEDGSISCTGEFEICFLVDGSGSIGSNAWRIMLQFVSDIVDMFTIGQTATRVALIQFGKNATLQWDICDAKSNDVETLRAAILGLKQTRGQTNTVEAMVTAIESAFPGSCERPDAKKIIIVLTDGQASERQSEIPDVSAQLQDFANDHVYIVGMTNAVNQKELETIAGDPARCFTTVQFDELINLIGGIYSSLCPTKEQCICCCPSMYGSGEGCGCTDDTVE